MIVLVLKLRAQEVLSLCKYRIFRRQVSSNPMTFTEVGLSTFQVNDRRRCFA